MKGKHLRLSIVIPVFNERDKIREIVGAVESVPLEGIEKEIVIVDDRSIDGTREILREFAEGRCRASSTRETGEKGRR